MSTNTSPNNEKNIKKPNNNTSYEKQEEKLRRMLTLRLQRLLVRNTASEFTYENLLPSRRLTTDAIDKAYRRKVAGNLREMVQRYEAKGGSTASSSSENLGSNKKRDEEDRDKFLDEGAMRAAFTMRERKHEQEKTLLDNTLHAWAASAGRDSVYNPIKRQKLKGVTEGLKIQQERLVKEYKRSLTNKVAQYWKQRPTAATSSAANGTELAHEVALFEEERKKLAQERRDQQELLRLEEEKKRRAKAEERVRERERQREERELERRKLTQEAEKESFQRKPTPEETLHRFYEPIFRALWSLEFPALNGTNPFRGKSVLYIIMFDRT